MSKTKLTAEDKLRGLIQDELAPMKDDFKDKLEARDEEIAKMKEGNSELKVQIETMESQPARKVNLTTPGTKDTREYMYKGYDLRYQANKLEIADQDRREAYAKFLIDVVVKSDMNEGTVGQGGYWVPDEYDMELITLAARDSFALNDCDVYTMGTDTLRLPTQASRVTVYTTAEAIALTQSDPTAGEVTLAPDKIGAYTVTSNELLMDEKVDMVSAITGMFADSLGYTLDTYVQNGNASGFTGVNSLSGDSGQYQSAAPSAVKASTISSTIAAIEGPYTRGAKFYMHRSVFHYIRSLKAGSSDETPVFAPMGGGVPGTMYEYPYFVSEAFPTATGVVDLQPYILFADLKNYALGRRVGFTSLQVDRSIKFLEGQVIFKIETRFAGAPKIDAAFSFIRDV